MNRLKNFPNLTMAKTLQDDQGGTQPQRRVMRHLGKTIEAPDFRGKVSSIPRKFALTRKCVVLLAAAASLIAGAEILQIGPGSAQEAGSLKNINAKSLCGTWQVMAGAGGSHQLTTVRGNETYKGSGQIRHVESVKYTIADTTMRTAVAVQTINIKSGHTYHMGDDFKAKAVRKLIGVTRQDVIMFAVQGEPNTEIWTPLSPSTYEVAGIGTGPHAMAYFYTIKQTSKSTCKAD